MPGRCAGNEQSPTKGGQAACSWRAKESELVRVGSKVCPRRIERVLRDGKTVVPFLLVESNRGSGQPNSFYIMENKVWNSLFAKFDPKYLYDEKADRLPVMGVELQKAYLFARWLGSSLPTCDQWDKAAGYFDQEEDRTGPFRPIGDIKGHVAVDRDEPMEVGTADADIGRFGCRDMAGNGQEFTCDMQNPREKIDEALDGNGPSNVLLRGKNFRDATP